MKTVDQIMSNMAEVVASNPDKVQLYRCQDGCDGRWYPGYRIYYDAGYEQFVTIDENGRMVVITMMAEPDPFCGPTWYFYGKDRLNEKDETVKAFRTLLVNSFK